MNGEVVLKTIAVLMSTYNGQKFVEQQIKSILSQTFSVDYKLTLFIRDDMSSDNTLDIINNLIKQNPNRIILIDNNNENLGVTKSFFKMLSLIKADYYFFSDQDDVWLCDKVKVAIEKLNETSSPALYYGAMIATNEKLEKVRNVNIRNSVPEYFNSLNQNLASGLTMAFNVKLVDIFLSKYNSLNTDNIVMHDAWLFLLAVTFGETIFDQTPYILYRQHNSNVVGATSNGLIDKIKKTKKVFFSEYLDPKFKIQALEMLDLYQNNISPSKIADIELLLAPRKLKRNIQVYKRIQLKNKLLSKLVQLSVLIGKY